MLNLAICDDERIEIEYLAALAHKWADERGFELHVREYGSAEQLLYAYEDDQALDILLLDIQMGGMDGIELARRLRQANGAMQIVFITGYPDFVAEGYEVDALHYLMKPVKEAKLFEVLDKAAIRLKAVAASLLITTPQAVERVLLRDICYIEAFAHYVLIQTKDGALETRMGIGELEREVGSAFVRCHRSYIVGLGHISRITKKDIILDNGQAIPLSRRLYADVNRAFIEFYKGR